MSPHFSAVPFNGGRHHMVAAGGAVSASTTPGRARAAWQGVQSVRWDCQFPCGVCGSGRGQAGGRGRGRGGSRCPGCSATRCRAEEAVLQEAVGGGGQDRDPALVGLVLDVLLFVVPALPVLAGGGAEGVGAGVQALRGWPPLRPRCRRTRVDEYADSWPRRRTFPGQVGLERDGDRCVGRRLRSAASASLRRRRAVWPGR